MNSPIGRRRVSKSKITRGRLIAVGLLMAFFAVLATVGLLRVYPPRPVMPAPILLGSQVAAGFEGIEIAILSTDSNQAYFESFGGGESVVTRPWLELFRKVGIRSRKISSLDDWNGEILFLPHAYCLSDDDCLRLEKGVEEGDGLLAAGPIGVRNPDGSWHGWDRMHSLLGSEEIREFGPEEMMFLYISPNGPIGTRSLSGYRIALNKRPSQWGLSGLPSAATWSNWMREPNPYTKKPFSAAAVGKIGAGKFAWIGFEPDLPVGDDRSIETSLTFLKEMVLWCADLPVCEPDLWPHGKETALLIATDTEHEFKNARLIDMVLTFYGIRGGFMCLSDLAMKHPELVKSLAERHDIGSHSDDHSRFDGQSLGQQAERLERSASDLSGLIGRPILGLRPPQEGVDEATYLAMAKTGLKYILGSGHTPNALPNFVSTPTKENPEAYIVNIPRAQRDDYELLEGENSANGNPLDDLLFDFNKTRHFHGIDYVSLHSQVMGREDNIAKLEKFLGSIPLEDLYIAGPDELAGWWIQRDAVKTSLKREDEEYVLFIENGSAEPIEGLGVWVSLPGNPDHLLVEGELKNLFGPDQRGAYRIDCEPIQPGSIQILRLKSGPAEWASVASDR